MSSTAVNDVINRKYVAALALVAVAILFIGVLLKPEKPAPEPPSPSETARLQRLLRSEELRSIGGYLAERASALARHVVWAPDQHSSGVRWGSGQVVTAPAQDDPGPISAIAAPDSQPGPQTAGLSAGQNWTLTVARGADGQALWNASLYGGERPASCGAVKYRELAVAIPSGSAFAGAGVFDMDGNLVGVVGRCRNEHVAIAARDVPSVLQTAVSVENLIPHRLGFLATPMKEREKEYFSVQSGLEVHTVRQHSLSDRAGLRPGDVIVAVADQEITSAHDLAPLLESAPPSLTIVRNGVKSKLTIPSPEETVSDAGDLGLDATALPTARTIVTVRPGSPAYEAGLRTGDVIVRIGLRVNPSAIEIRRLLARRNGQPTFVVYERGMERTGVLVSK